MLPFLGRDRRVASVVLLADGASFLLMTVLFTTLGSAADYGNASSVILFGATVLCWMAQLGFLFVGEGGWRAAIGLYIGGMVTYGVTLVFYASVFPRLARNTPATKIALRKIGIVDGCGGDGAEAERDAVKVEALERARLSGHSTAHSNWGYLFVLLLSLSLLLPSSTKHLPRVEVYVLVLTVAYWFVFALPWFILQKPRPGPPLPNGASWLTIGWKQIAAAAREYKHLPYTFAYLAGFFLLADGVNTTGALIRVLQARQTHFSFLSITLLNLSQAFFSILSCYVFLYLQRRHALPSKRMLLLTNLVSIAIPAWGLLGLREGSKVGFRSNWEFGGVQHRLRAGAGAVLRLLAGCHGGPDAARRRRDVVWPVWADESREQLDRAERLRAHHREDGERLGAVRLPHSDLRRCDGRDCVRCQCRKGASGRSRVHRSQEGKSRGGAGV